MDKDTFEETIAKDGLIEYASYCGNYYGTPREYVEACLDNGRDVILEIEIQGALKVKEKNSRKPFFIYHAAQRGRIKKKAGRKRHRKRGGHLPAYCARGRGSGRH